MANACQRCGHGDALKFSVCLVNIDEESFEEGSHVADVDLRLCSECEEGISDALLDFVGDQVQADDSCDDCGTTENVEQVECPYADQVHDEVVMAWLCRDCWGRRGQRADEETKHGVGQQHGTE